MTGPLSVKYPIMTSQIDGIIYYLWLPKTDGYNSFTMGKGLRLKKARSDYSGE